MHSYPGMVALITVNSGTEKNIMAAGWHSFISMDPPMYGVAIGKGRYTYSLVQQANHFGVNFVPYEFAEFIQESGTWTGEETDKFKDSGMEWFLGEKLGVPIVKEAYLAYELVVQDCRAYGDHDWFVGEIVQTYQDDELFGTDGLPDFNKLTIPLYLGRSTYLKINDKTEKNQFIIK
ncbi:flavin oxidoreductase [Bacillus coahuilensis m2-6]|nr:flavin oxidoreductase [Bacillus coahuilensis m2-6]